MWFRNKKKITSWVSSSKKLTIFKSLRNHSIFLQLIGYNSIFLKYVSAKSATEISFTELREAKLYESLFLHDSHSCCIPTLYRREKQLLALQLTLFLWENLSYLSSFLSSKVIVNMTISYKIKLNCEFLFDRCSSNGGFDSNFQESCLSDWMLGYLITLCRVILYCKDKKTKQMKKTFVFIC